MNKYIEHFKTITKHKWYVMKYCFKCGRYKRGLLHDLSKYGITEFASSARNFQGNRSPIEVEKDKYGYSIAWQHHKGHNPHHWEYWIDNIGPKPTKELVKWTPAAGGNVEYFEVQVLRSQPTPVKIPYEYVIEMLCDWLGAGIVYSKQKVDESKPYKEPLEYYNAHKSERIFHPETQKVIEYFLGVIASDGINVFCEMTKHIDSYEIFEATAEE